MTTINENRIYPFVPTTPLSDAPAGTHDFVNVETGEILSFPPSWDAEGMEHILLANLMGDYEEQGVLFGSCTEMSEACLCGCGQSHDVCSYGSEPAQDW